MSETQRCAYCGQVRPVSEMEQGRIHFRNSRWDSTRGRHRQFVDEKTHWYCKDKRCHSHDQMAHEG